MSLPSIVTAICRVAGVLFAAYFLALAGAWSQEPEIQPKGQESQASSPTGEATSTSADSQAQAAESAAPDKENSPFDYEATEQISEDLSVSFPVDI